MDKTCLGMLGSSWAGNVPLLPWGLWAQLRKSNPSCPAHPRKARGEPGPGQALEVKDEDGMSIAPGVTWRALTWPSSGAEAQGENPCSGQGNSGVGSCAGWKRRHHKFLSRILLGRGRGRAWGPSPYFKSTGTPKPSTALTGPRACAGAWRHLLCQPGLCSAWEMLPPGSNSHHPISDTVSATSWDHCPQEAAEPFQSADFWLQFMFSADQRRPRPFDLLFRGPSGPRDTDPSLGEEVEGRWS